MTPAGTLFAATLIFRVNDVTAAVTLPQGMVKGDPAIAWDYYSRLMIDPKTVKQTGKRARFDGKQWNVEGKDIRLHYLGDGSGTG